MGIRANARTAFFKASQLLALAWCATLLLSLPLPAQTLARPGWAGSGIGSETWWRNAVFYRIDVPHFQDSDGDGKGDLPGIAQRLDYLQSLGIDAIIIPTPADDATFNTLLREASARRIRIIIAFSSTTRPADILGQARLWLTRGAAGIDLEPTFFSSENLNTSLRDLRALVDSFPGQRILMARPMPSSTPAIQSSAELVATPIDPLISGHTPFQTADYFRTSSGLEAQPAFGTPLLETFGGSLPGDRFRSGSNDNATRSIGMQKIIATRLLTSRSATSLVYGQEIGMVNCCANQPPMMRWTPTNITPPKTEPEPEAPATPAPPSDPTVYGAFKPYVPPKPAPKPKTPGEPVNPNSLPGFTTAANAAVITPPEDPRLNVALEDADPNSLLNFYRRLSQLHHGNASLRTGTPYILNHDAERALVWLRRAPAHARTAATVVITCNLSDQPITLSLDSDFARLRIRTGTLRPLLASWTTAPIAQYSGHITLPPYSVFIGELFH